MIDIDPETRAALERFAHDHGTEWKTTLNLAWMRGQSLDAYPGLYALRNSHGPSWLETVSIPKT